MVLYISHCNYAPIDPSDMERFGSEATHSISNLATSQNELNLDLSSRVEQLNAVTESINLHYVEILGSRLEMRLGNALID